MCGIWCAFSKNCEFPELSENYDAYFKESIKRRGPNNHHKIDFRGKLSGECNVLFAASVLWLQGNKLTKQPIESDKSIFLLNGDIFQCDNELENDRNIIGDTKIFHQILETAANVKESLMQLKGPYAFIYLEKNSGVLYFGRDPFGRRSLLIGKNANKGTILTSVARKSSGYDFIELPALGIFTIDLKSFQIELSPWNGKHENFSENIRALEVFLNTDIKIQDVQPTVNNFENPSQSQVQFFNFVQKDDYDLYMQHLLNNHLWNDNVLQFEHVLKEAVRKRIENQPKKCQGCFNSELDIPCNHAYIGILFSGGLDCSVLALIAEEFISANNPIDLINVSFDEKTGFNSPDRVTGLASLNELKLLKPNRQWNFVPVNVMEEELNTLRKKRISDLIYPLNSILDDSLGCALWFASRAWSETYKSPSRVLIVGMGADELLGGYTKHRRAFKQGGWSGLNDSLNLDWQNISVRNLARDDRVVSDHGRQLRTPYLDENVVEFLRNLPNWQKMYLHDDVAQGIGDKILLRSLAYHLGFRQVVSYKKRALQFGSRIANNN